MIQPSVIKIHKKAFKKNLRFLRRYYGKNVKISSVVKGNAYGHDISTFVPLAEECNIDHFSVFSSGEAMRVLEASNGNSTIMIMGYIDNADIEWAIKNDIQFWVFEFDRLQKAIESSKKIGKKAKIHIEVETGMNRTGFARQDITKLQKILFSNIDHLSFEGLCTHYAGAESIANYVRIRNQIKRYKAIHNRFVRKGLIPKLRHTACSAASVVYPDTRMDMVRLGVMQYGYWPAPEVFIHYIKDKTNNKNPLNGILSWESKIMSIKEVKKGDFVGYGLNYLAQNDMRYAVIPVGYSNGYSRSLSHMGRVIINGKRCDVMGIINMNLLIASLTKLQNAQKGDPVVIIGKQKSQKISVASFSNFSDEINYETLSRLPQNIPRTVV